MTRSLLLILPAPLLILCVALAPTQVSAQSFQPKSIQFKGDPGHSDAELFAASGLKKGAVLTSAEMNDHTKLLMDSGIFENITFTFNGENLILQLVPATALYPIRLENLPVLGGKALDDKLHARLPLYHGVVPITGGLLDDVRKELLDELATKGILATIITTPYNELKSGKVTAISFSITAPAVRVGEINLEASSPSMADKALQATARAIGSNYSVDGSVSQLETSVGNFYHEQGYLEATVHAKAQLPVQTAPIADAEGVHIPFSVVVDEGPQYKLAAVHLAPDLVVTQVAFDKQSQLHLGETVSLEKLRGEWGYLLRQYHNNGLMKAQILPTPTYDRAQGTVSYLVTAEPGPVYSMGAFKVENVSDDLKAAIVSVWKVPAGAVFNEGAMMSLSATPAFAKLFSTVDLRYSLNLHDDVRTVDVVLRLERKH